MAIPHRSTLRLMLNAVRERAAKAPMDGSRGGSLWQRLIHRSKEAAPKALLPAELEPAGPCPACRLRSETESMYLHKLLEHVDDAEIEAALQQGRGLRCAPPLPREGTGLEPAPGLRAWSQAGGNSPPAWVWGVC